MNKEALSKSIMLTGPKMVGKSLVSKELGNLLNMEVVSSDDLFIFVMQLHKYTNIPNFKISLYKNPICRSAAAIESIDKYISKMQKYDSQFNLYEFFSIVDDYTLAMQVWNPLIDNNNTKMFCNQKVAYEFLKKLLSKINKPVILDVGCQIDVEYGLTDSDKRTIEMLFDSKYSNMIKHHHDLLNLVGNRIFMSPSPSYYETPSEELHDELNEMSLKSLSSYKDFATATLTTNQFFNDPKNPVFSKRTLFDTEAFSVKEKLKNKEAISDFCNKIISVLEQEKEK